MRCDRIYTEQPLRAGAKVELEAGPRRHVTQVLRLGVGDALVLFNGDGRDYPARLLRATTAAAIAAVEPELETQAEPDPPLAVTIALGITKGERMDYALQKAVELGAAGFVPLFSERSVVKLRDDRLEKRTRHWQGVIIAACEQCGRRRLPTLAAPQRLGAWLDALPAGHHGLLLHHRAEAALTDQPTPATGRVTLLVGPEGGLAPGERTAALERGFAAVRLGPRVLRAETAPLAALAAMQALWGDFRD
jgi:16S rRNA (uracil1498-N3)-methyltransferase